MSTREQVLNLHHQSWTACCSIYFIVFWNSPIQTLATQPGRLALLIIFYFCAVTLLTGDIIYITGACGALAPGICPSRWGFCGWSFLNSMHELLVCEDLSSDARYAEILPGLLLLALTRAHQPTMKRKNIAGRTGLKFRPSCVDGFQYARELLSIISGVAYSVLFC